MQYGYSMDVYAELNPIITSKEKEQKKERQTVRTKREQEKRVRRYLSACRRNRLDRGLNKFLVLGSFIAQSTVHSVMYAQCKTDFKLR